MRLRIDHITLAADSLDRATACFAGRGLAADYGGPHENGVTHMAQLGFPDGSYVEFIAPLAIGSPSPLWGQFMAESAAPCAWCVESDDVAAESARLRARSVPVRGPVDRGRRRPDGVKLDWRLAFVGEGSPGSTYPFVIQDVTPKAWRVSESPCTGQAGLVGVEAVILCVPDLDAAAAQLRAAYDLPPAVAKALPGLEADVIGFPGEPILLARPDARSPELAERLARFGPAPCGGVFATRDMRLSLERLAPGRGGAEPADGVAHLAGLTPGPASYFAIAEAGWARGGA